MKRKKFFVLGLVILVLVVVSAVFFWKRSEDTNKKTEIKLDDSLVIREVGSYSGVYMEDGTDEAVKDVMMVMIENAGDKILQYAELTIPLEDGIAEFAFSTLGPGEKMIVLEKNRLEYSQKKDSEDITLDNVVYFDEEPAMNEDVIKVQELEGALNIENITDQDITGPVAVYYKNAADGIYQGGITYRALVKEGLKAGEIRQVMTNHFSIENSEILFVTYVP